MAKKTYGEIFEDIVDQVGLTNSFNDWVKETRRIKRDINQIQKQVLSISKSYLTKAGVLIVGWTVVDQNNYTITDWVDKITDVKITSWWVEYYPDEISITKFHTLDNTNSSSDIPVFWTVDKWELYIFPTPETASLPIELNANKYATDLITDPSVLTDQATKLEIKEWYENVIYYYALTEAFNRLEDFASWDRYDNKFKEMFKDYKKEVRSPTNNIIVWGKSEGIINPNYYNTLT